MGITEPKAPRGSEPLFRTLLDYTSQPTIHISLLIPSYKGSVNAKGFPASCRSFISCAPQDGHQCLCQSMALQALEALHHMCLAR